MVFHTSQKDNGSVENVQYHPRTRYSATCVPTKAERSSRQFMASGYTCCVQYGYQRRGLPMMSSWSLSLVLRRYRNNVGNWCVRPWSSTIVLTGWLEVLGMRCSRRGLHPVRQIIVLHRLPRDLCSPGKAASAHENDPRR